jgi:hypothetical protein
MNEETVFAYGRIRLMNLAREYMVSVYGQPNECEDKDGWYAHYGVLVGFVDSITAPTPPHPNSEPINNEGKEA